MNSFKLYYFLTVIILLFITVKSDISEEECVTSDISEEECDIIEIHGKTDGIGELIVETGGYSLVINPNKIPLLWKKSKYILTGLGVNDGAEVIRILLTLLNVEFEYVTLDDENWKTIQANLIVGKIPVMEIDSKVLIAQPVAVFNYLANLAELHGKTHQDKLIIDTYVANIMYWHDEVFSYYYETNETSKETKLSKLMTKTVPDFVQLFNNVVRENKAGYIFGENLSVVDLMCINTLNFIKIATNYEVCSKKFKALTELSVKVSEDIQKLDKKRNHKSVIGKIVNENYINNLKLFNKNN